MIFQGGWGRPDTWSPSLDPPMSMEFVIQNGAGDSCILALGDLGDRSNYNVSGVRCVKMMVRNVIWRKVLY